MTAQQRLPALGAAILAGALTGGCNLVSGLSDLTIGDTTPSTGGTASQVERA